MKAWKLRFTPRNWQVDALERWKKGLRGIVEVVTGGGKTVLAQMCLIEFFKSYKNGQALILVPTVSLLDQWCVALQEDIGLLPDDIGLLSGEESCQGDEPIIVAVINSARSFTQAFSSNRDIFLIVDECHRAGSPQNAKALLGQFVATLGLSATPEREYDDGMSMHVVPQLGPIIFKYSYVEASRDGVITSFSLTNVRVQFLADETDAYERFSRAIARVRRSQIDTHDEEKLKRLLQQRAAVSSNATRRIPVAVKLLEQHKSERVVVFHERIEAANSIVSILRARGHRATVYHANIGPAARRDNLRLFRKGQFDVLVCCKALDEGINVPEASVAVIASSTASHRQRIQRLGRILRTAEGKKASQIYTIFVTNEEMRRLRREEEHLAEITSVTWQQWESEQSV